MRIAFVCTDPGVPVFGQKGGSAHVRAVVRGMKQCGAHVELFARRLGGQPPPDLETLPVHQLARVHKAPDAERENALLSSNRSTRDAIQAAGPFDMIYERHALWSHAPMEHAAECKIPGILEVNALLVEEQQRYRNLVHVQEAREVADRSMQAASALLAVSSHLRTRLEEIPAASGRVHVIRNGVDTDRFFPSLPPSLPALNGAFTIGFVGSLRPWHAVDTLIEAFSLLRSRHSRLRLLVVGDGPQRRTILDQKARLGLGPEVVLTGAVESDDIPALLNSMDVAVAPYHPSDDFYFSPLKLFEYMAAGRATVASRSGQIGDVIQDGVTGLLTTPGDAGELAQKVGRLLDDTELRIRLGRAARDQAVNNHDWNQVVDRIMQIAGQCASKPAIQWSSGG